MAKGVDRELLRTIYTRMQQGYTTQAIGEELGIPQSHVSRFAQKKNMDAALTMLTMADDGYTLEEIGKRFGVSKQRVHQLIGTQGRAGSSGKVVYVDASPETWAAMTSLMESLDLPVRKIKGFDARALTMMMDAIAAGEFVVSRRRRATS